MEKRLWKAIYAVLSVLAPAAGTAAGLAGAVTAGFAWMEDASHYSQKELDEVSPWDHIAEFQGSHMQAELVSQGITLLVILSIVTLAAVIALCVLTGRFNRDENGRPRLNWFDRQWSEVQAALVLCASGGAVVLAFPIFGLMRCDNHFGFIDLSRWFRPLLTDEYMYDIPNDTVFWYCTAGMAVCLWIAVTAFVSLVKKIKAHELIQRSLLGKVLKLLGWSARQTGHGAKAGLKGAAAGFRRITVPADSDRHAVLKIICKYCLIALLLIILPETLALMFGSSGVFVVAEIAAALAAILLIVRKFRKLMEIRAGVIEVKSGNLRYKIPVVEDDHGPKTDLDKLASNINHISEATNLAVQNEVKNQRLKTDLISNVSHDLKTPLTSMISYLDILEKEGLDSEDAPAHLAIVREKTERLKTLTEELFEAAKASSGNIPCEIETIDLAALIDQSLAEMGDRLAGKGLDIRKKIRTDQTLVLADGKLLYRVLENLLGNISKYALENSRVYIDVSKPEIPGAPGKTLLEVKNISRDELNITPDELMERFTRGDQSRTTEGSGLGLAIAKDLTTLMGGTFTITIDGDMFKVSILLNEAPANPCTPSEQGA